MGIVNTNKLVSVVNSATLADKNALLTNTTLKQAKADTTYGQQVLTLTDALKRWDEYITENTSVILQFQDTVQNIQDQLDRLETKVSALAIKVDKLQSQIDKYVKLSTNAIRMYPVKGVTQMSGGYALAATNAYALNTFDSYTSENEVYVYSNKTVSGLFLDDVEIVSVNDASLVANASYFYKYNGSDQGLTHELKAINTKNNSDIKLIFSYDNRYRDITIDDSSSAVLKVDIGPASAVSQTTIKPTVLIDSLTGQSAVYLQSTSKVANQTAKLNATKVSK